MNKKLLEASEAFKKGTHTSEQFSLLMDALPPDVRKEMDKRAGEILGLDFSKPDAYAETGEPLFKMNRDELKARTGVSDNELDNIEKSFGMEHIKPAANVSLFNQNLTLSQPLFVETDQKDENGDPIYHCSAEGAGMLLISSALDHNTGKDSAAKANGIFVKWMALARQRGVSSIIIDRLTVATKKEKNPNQVLADVIRVTRKASVIDVLNC